MDTRKGSGSGQGDELDGRVSMNRVFELLFSLSARAPQST